MGRRKDGRGALLDKTRRGWGWGKAPKPREGATVAPKTVSGQRPPSPARPVAVLSIYVLLVVLFCFSAGGGGVRRKSRPNSTEKLSRDKPDSAPALPCTTPGHALGPALGLGSAGRRVPRGRGEPLGACADASVPTPGTALRVALTLRWSCAFAVCFWCSCS